MKKFLTAICTVVLVAILAVSLAGCGKSTKVKTAFKNAGYEITAVDVNDSEDLKKLLKSDEQKKDIKKYEVFTCKNLSRVATVIKFPSNKTMQEVLGESTYKTKDEGGYVNDDCYMVSGSTDALYVFKNA